MTRLFLLILVLLAPSVAMAQSYEKDAYKIEAIVQGFDLPWSIAFLPNGDFLVTELSGDLRVVRNGTLLSEKIAGVPKSYFAGQGGLMDVVLHPDFASNRMVYLSLAAGTQAQNATRIVRGELVGNALKNVQTVFESAPAKDTAVHYGGRMAFLADKTLLITLGDGFNYREEAQNLATHYGTIVRVTDTGKVPPDNPFIGNDSAQPEIWSYGHRNPQSIVFDAPSGRVFQTEHGARGGDELNLIERGKNYGWPIITLGVDYSGARVSPYTEYEGMEQPLHDWTPSIAPAGMTLYRGSMFPQWVGDIFVTSLVFNNVTRLDMDGARVKRARVMFKEIDARIRDIRTGPDGALYILSEKTNETSGKIWRVSPIK